MGDFFLVTIMIAFFVVAVEFVRVIGRAIEREAGPGRLGAGPGGVGAGSAGVGAGSAGKGDGPGGRGHRPPDTGGPCYRDWMAADFVPVGGVEEETLAEAVLLASAADTTPVSRSIVDFGESRFPIVVPDLEAEGTLVPFSARTRMSGIDIHGRRIRKGAAQAVTAWVMDNGGTVPDDLDGIVAAITEEGGAAVVIADSSPEGAVILGIVRLQETVPRHHLPASPNTQKGSLLPTRMRIRARCLTGPNAHTGLLVSAASPDSGPSRVPACAPSASSLARRQETVGYAGWLPRPPLPLCPLQRPRPQPPSAASVRSLRPQPPSAASVRAGALVTHCPRRRPPVRAVIPCPHMPERAFGCDSKRARMRTRAPNSAPIYATAAAGRPGATEA